MSQDLDLTQQELPWHTTQWQGVETALHADRFPHAVLLAGSSGMGKHAFAQRLAAVLLCTDTAVLEPCGKCRSCELRVAGTHPDQFIITLQIKDDGKQRQEILIDQIRVLIAALALRPSFSTRKVVVIEPAEKMNKNAENALLKVLEEPPGDTVLILVTDHPYTLRATIRSRCQEIGFQHAKPEAVHDWLADQVGQGVDVSRLLEMSQGSPLLALDLFNDGQIEKRQSLLADIQDLMAKRTDPSKIAKAWLAVQPAPRTLETIETLTADLIRFRSGANSEQLVNRDLAKPLQLLGKELDLFVLFRILDGVGAAWRQSSGNSSVKDETLLTDVAIQWAWAGQT